LTALAPGAIDNGAGDQRTIRFAGHGLDDNNLTLDGVDATAVYNQEQREYMRLNVPLDSIDQFQVQSQNFGADVQGGTAGGQVAVVSPSGTNTFHGDLFDYFRNDALEARTPFNQSVPVESIWRGFRRAHRARQDIFLRQLRGAAAAPGRDADRIGSEPQLYRTGGCDVARAASDIECLSAGDIAHFEAERVELRRSGQAGG
jgi:hypothetical protein